MSPATFRALALIALAGLALAAYRLPYLLTEPTPTHHTTTTTRGDAP